MKVIYLICLSLLLVSCKSTKVPVMPDTGSIIGHSFLRLGTNGERTIINRPEFKREHKSATGESLLQVQDATIVTTLKLNKSVTVDGVFGGDKVQFVVPSGELPLIGVKNDSLFDNGSFYGGEGFLRMITQSNNRVKIIWGGISIPLDNKIDKASIFYFYKSSLKAANVAELADYELIETIEPNNKGLKRELNYVGKTGSSILVEYREFSNGMARPAFTQALTFDLSDSKIIGYKGAKIEVLEATNTEIVYRVLSSM